MGKGGNELLISSLLRIMGSGDLRMKFKALFETY